MYASWWFTKKYGRERRTMAESYQQQLSTFGWRLSDEGLTACIQRCHDAGSEVTAATLHAVALDLDLRQIGAPCIREEVWRGLQVELQGPLMLQIQKVRNVALPPSTAPSSRPSRRLLRLQLTDGHVSVGGLEVGGEVSGIGPLTPPGTKVKLVGCVRAQNRFLLLNSSSLVHIGGKVEALEQKWALQMAMPANLARGRGDGNGPPPFEPFRKKPSSSGAKRRGQHSTTTQQGTETAQTQQSQQSRQASLYQEKRAFMGLKPHEGNSTIKPHPSKIEIEEGTTRGERQSEEGTRRPRERLSEKGTRKPQKRLSEEGTRTRERQNEDRARRPRERQSEEGTRRPRERLSEKGTREPQKRQSEEGTRKPQERLSEKGTRTRERLSEDRARRPRERQNEEARERQSEEGTRTRARQNEEGAARKSHQLSDWFDQKLMLGNSSERDHHRAEENAVSMTGEGGGHSREVGLSKQRGSGWRKAAEHETQKREYQKRFSREELDKAGESRVAPPLSHGIRQQTSQETTRDFPGTGDEQYNWGWVSKGVPSGAVKK